MRIWIQKTTYQTCFYTSSLSGDYERVHCGDKKQVGLRPNQRPCTNCKRLSQGINLNASDQSDVHANFLASIYNMDIIIQCNFLALQ